MNADSYTSVGFDRSETVSPQPIRSLRGWPAVVLIVMAALVRFVPVWVEGASLPLLMLGFMGPAVLSLALAVWWLFFSGASWREKGIGIGGLAGIVALSSLTLDPSMRGISMFFWIIPVGMAAFAIPLVVASHYPRVRVWLGLAGALLGFGVWNAFRSDGVTGEFAVEFRPRWSVPAETDYLESRGEASNSPVALDPSNSNIPWPEFRGPNRDGSVSGVSLLEDWERNPPELVWKRAIGPGWSSFAVAENHLFTQEQVGDQEAVVCLNAETGDTVWTYSTPGRFAEEMGGVGPRATPTYHAQRIYALGADGMVVCLNASDGKEVWKRELMQDASRKQPPWGFSSSPLIVNDIVVVHAGGSGDKGVFAYSQPDGSIRWQVASGDHSYSSPQKATFDGTAGILMATNEGLQFLDPTSGATIWNHEWKIDTYRAVQTVVDGNAVFVAASLGNGIRRLNVSREEGTWKIEPQWTSRDLKPDFNDMVAYQGTLYGFDATIFGAVSMDTGKRLWKKGRYGAGQVLLLADTGHLLVAAESGELVLLKASREKLDEVARIPAIDSKTWNHPVVVGDRVYVRNSQQAACYKLPVATDP
ncbi:PQQ-binding-like beta-propeller repeat protein [Pirellulaceae bacterium SH467]